jgi:hypothetical protein
VATLLQHHDVVYTAHEQHNRSAEMARLKEQTCDRLGVSALPPLTSGAMHPIQTGAGSSKSCMTTSGNSIIVSSAPNCGKNSTPPPPRCITIAHPTLTLGCSVQWTML